MVRLRVEEVVNLLYRASSKLGERIVMIYLLCSSIPSVASNRRVHGATPHPYQRRRQGGSAPLIKYHLVLGLFKMPQKYALLVAYKADCGGRGCAAQHRRPFYRIVKVRLSAAPHPY
jgi:hypothetical protein